MRRPLPSRGGLPVAEQDAVGAGLGLEHDLAAVGDQHPRAGPALARLHVLGEDQDLVARRLDDRVEIAAEHQRRRLERLLVGDLDDVDARQLELLELVGRLDRLVPGVAGDRDRPLGVGGDQADVERLDVLEPVLLAEIRLGVELVGGET